MPTIDAERARVQDDLRGLIAGEVRCDDLFLQQYATDGSICEIKPLGVVRPRTKNDVVTCVQYASEKSIPIHARGAGTGAAGACLGPGLVLDFSRYLRRVLDKDGQSVRVQPGLVHERLNAYLADRGRLFGPDPATSACTTIGSVIAVDAAGSRWLKYGSACRHVLGLEVVLPDGTIMEVGREPLSDPAKGTPPTRKRDLVSQIVELLRSHREVIGRMRHPSGVSRCGYQLQDVLDETHLDLARLVVGSEGTLALITEAVVATEPLPRHRGVALLLFDNMDKAARAVQDVLSHRPSACDLMDRRHLSLARESEVRFDVLLPAAIEAVLLVEQDGDSSVEVRDRLYHLVEQVRDRRGLAFASRQAFDPDEMDLFWSLAKKTHPGLHRIKSPARPLPLVEDIFVGPDMLPELLVRTQNTLKRHELVASIFCHAGRGQLHIRPFLDLASATDVTTMQRLMEDLFETADQLGGSMGGGSAYGLIRTPFLQRQCGPISDALGQLKNIFDPQNVFNPGKIVGAGGDAVAENLRFLAAAPRKATAENVRAAKSPKMRDLVELQLNWDPNQVADTARMCNGCGECRSQASPLRMCPMFRMAPAEESSPRAKANLIRGVLTGRLDLTLLTTDEFKEVADLCYHCYMCVLECPARVDIPKLMLEGKGAYVAANGLRLADWITARLDLCCALGNLIRPVSNWALANRQMRWIMEKLLGIAQGRKLPRLASRSFLRRAAKRKLTRPTRRTGNKVAYFVDSYVNYHDPQLGQALVAVMEHNGVAVFVPPEQKQAGMAAIAVGALDIARDLAESNVAVFADAVRQGYHIVASEPAVIVCLQREYPSLISDEDARLVAENSSEACTYLWRMHTQGKLQLDFKPLTLSLGYHTPCRLKALRVGTPGEHLLGLIPGVTVDHIEEGCSGMAGTFGLKRQNYRTSLRIGRSLIGRLRDPRLQAGTTECSTCKMQMEQGTTMPTVHPLKLLALAYGLMPEIGPALTTPGEELIVT